MTLRDVLNLMDEEVWVRVRVNDAAYGWVGKPDDDLVLWSADWLAGGEGDPGMPDGLGNYIDWDADDLCIETGTDPEDGETVSMLVVNAYPPTVTGKNDEE